MWRLLPSLNGNTGHPKWSQHLFRTGERTPITRHHLALAEAGRWLAEALVGSPHAVYVRSNGVFEPAVVRGIEHAPVFAAEGSLPRTLGRTCRPVMTTRSHCARLFDAALDPVDRDSLQRTGAIALVPLSQDLELEAFLLVAGPVGAFDPDRLARALAPVSACLRIARDGAPRPGPEHPHPVAGELPALALSCH
jgi:hypothetical protein